MARGAGWKKVLGVSDEVCFLTSWNCHEKILTWSRLFLIFSQIFFQEEKITVSNNEVRIVQLFAVELLFSHWTEVEWDCRSVSLRLEISGTLFENKIIKDWLNLVPKIDSAIFSFLFIASRIRKNLRDCSRRF